jgi:dihydroorotate dehydrogenase electron transfer subunit
LEPKKQKLVEEKILRDSVIANYTDNNEYKTLLNKNLSNKKSYNTFCFAILNILYNKLDTKICYLNKKCFDKTLLSIGVNGHSSLIKDKIITENCAFILKNSETNLVFSFGHQGIENLQNLSNYIFSIDHNKFKYIHIIIFKNFEELDEARQVNNAYVYKRSFFTSCEEIWRKVIEIDKVTFERIALNKWKPTKSLQWGNHSARIHNIKIIDNIPVGKGDSKLYKLSFQTEEPIDIVPGQFVMISTRKEKNEFKSKTVHSISEVKPNLHNDLQTKPISYLKRPFGIYRTYYENFTDDYISKLDLEKPLASILYTLMPNRFEIVYKVLDRGVGTNELTRLAKNDRVEVLAPLGKVFNLRELLKEKLDEIHIVGGGVGIAPLVFFAQVMRSLRIKVKAFIGIDSLSSLTYEDSNKKSYPESGKNSLMYIDDLELLGLSRTSDIYVSFLCSTDQEQIKGIQNVFKGSFVTEPYAEYLKKHNDLKILTFACGPSPMMQKVHNLTASYKIKSYVLMEKRMACGIGVCFSCVCKTIENGEPHYSRVCIEGPIIESKQINWNE